MGTVKQTVDKTKRNITKGIDKIKQFRKTRAGQFTETLANTALNALRSSGLGQRLNDRLNNAIAPLTQHSIPLDTLRKIIHASNHFYLHPQALGTPNYQKSGQQHTIHLTRQNYEPAIKVKPARYVARRR